MYVHLFGIAYAIFHSPRVGCLSNSKLELSLLQTITHSRGAGSSPALLGVAIQDLSGRFARLMARNRIPTWGHWESGKFAGLATGMPGALG